LLRRFASRAVTIPPAVSRTSEPPIESNRYALADFFRAKTSAKSAGFRDMTPKRHGAPNLVGGGRGFELTAHTFDAWCLGGGPE
jgi:hypothetical protein